MIYWLAFGILIIFLLALDLMVFHKRAHQVKTKEAIVMTTFWIVVALMFNGWVWFQFGGERATTFFTSFIIEKALSVDNLFVFIIVFRYFAVKSEYQHRILFWGVLGAIVFRLIFIMAGVELIERFHWVLYLLSLFLFYVGGNLLLGKDTEVHPENNWVLNLFRHYVRTTTEIDRPCFLVRQNGLLYATPLLLVLVAIETTDIMFAIDSVPAILAITTDRFIVFTSNIFAILGLRSVYFLLVGMVGVFHFLKYGLGLILIFVGIKMIVEGSLIGKVPCGLSLIVIAIILTTSVLASVIFPRKE
jgi:tellurite resistance protein TerC